MPYASRQTAVIPWTRHALALALLAALSLGLYGRLYSPLDYAYPEGEAASASITRFIAENPHPGGWNPTRDGGQPTQTTALPAFHYAAALVAKLGNEPVYAHRLVAVTMALLAPLALYFLLVTFGMSWPWALAAGAATAALSPLSTAASIEFRFLPARLLYVYRTGQAPFVAGVTLALLAWALVWRAGLRPSGLNSFLAALSISLVLLTDSNASLLFVMGSLMLLLTMLGIAGEYGFSHRRMWAVYFWAYLLSCFWLTPDGMGTLFNWPASFPWLPILFGAAAIRLGFLGRRQPLLCFTVLSLWVLGYLALSSVSPRETILLEIFLLVGITIGLSHCLTSRQILWRFAGGLLLLAMLVVRIDFAPVSFRLPPLAMDFGLEIPHRVPTSPRIRFLDGERLRMNWREWRGDWGMRPPQESDAFRLTRWFVEHPPQGRILSRVRRFSQRLNAWATFAQSSESRSRDSEYLVEDWQAAVGYVYQGSSLCIRRLPFVSLATSSQGQALSLSWLSASHLLVTGTLPPGQTILVKVNHHAGWRSSSGLLERSEDGFLRLAPVAGPVRIELTYHGTRQQSLFGYLSAFAWAASLAYVAYRSWRG